MVVEGSPGRAGLRVQQGPFPGSTQGGDGREKQPRQRGLAEHRVWYDGVYQPRCGESAPAPAFVWRARVLREQGEFLNFSFCVFCHVFVNHRSDRSSRLTIPFVKLPISPLKRSLFPRLSPPFAQIDKANGGQPCTGADQLPPQFEALLSCQVEKKAVWNCQRNPRAVPLK